MREKLLTTREASQLLNISEQDIIDLTHLGKIPHFKVAGEFLRFRKDDIFKLKREIQKRFDIHREIPPLAERMQEFLYFNDFYILSTIIIMMLLWVIFKS